MTAMLDTVLINELLDRGVSSDDARRIAKWLAQESPTGAWTRIYRDFLTPAHDFSLHQWLYECSYGDAALLVSPGPAWLPQETDIARANVTAVAAELRLVGFRALHRWSVEHREEYWGLVARRLNIQLRRPYEQMLDSNDPQRARWLVGAKLNIVESCLAGEPDAAAIVESDGSGPSRTRTLGELQSLVARVANSLRAGGIGRGDAVAVIGPMTSESVAAYLGVIAIGAAVVSIADSFSAEEIAARLRIVGAKLVVTRDFVRWSDKRLPLYEKIAAATSLPAVVIHDDPAESTRLRTSDQLWDQFLSSDERLECAVCDPADAINILFSSGTTGEPKAIPWDHTTPLKCAADAHFHHDLHPGDVACWPTNLGWMMGPWQIFATLLNRSAMALYGQAPHTRAFGEFVSAAGVTMLGGVPSLFRSWRQSECMRGLDWSRIRSLSSTGECSHAADMLYLMHLAGYRPIIEYCGGTEIGGGYVTSTVVQPSVPAAFSTPALGIDLALLDERGQPTTAGEVYLIGPSIGLSQRLLNRDHATVYYNGTPADSAGHPLRRHGDELHALAGGYFRVAGRTDDTMNLGGIKVSCAEIERAWSGLAGVQETAAVAISPPGGGPSRLVAFVVPDPAAALDPEILQSLLQQAIRRQLNPLFRLDEVRLIGNLPRTASNKVLRRELRALLEGSPSKPA